MYMCKHNFFILWVAAFVKTPNLQASWLKFPKNDTRINILALICFYHITAAAGSASAAAAASGNAAAAAAAGKISSKFQSCVLLDKCENSTW